MPKPDNHPYVNLDTSRPVKADFFNQVVTVIWDLLGDGADSPTTKQAVLNNLGVVVGATVNQASAIAANSSKIGIPATTDVTDGSVIIYDELAGIHWAPRIVNHDTNLAAGSNRINYIRGIIVETGISPNRQFWLALSDRVGTETPGSVPGAFARIDRNDATQSTDDFINATLTGTNLVLTRRNNTTVTLSLPSGGPGTVSSDSTLSGTGASNDRLRVTNPFTATQENAITSNTSKRTYPQADEDKLAGIAEGATVGATQAQSTAIATNTSDGLLDFTGASISGSILTLTRRNASTVTLTLPAGGGSSNTYDASTTSDLNALIPTTTGMYNYSISNPTNGPTGIGSPVFVTVNRQGNDLVQVLYGADSIYVRSGRSSYTTAWVDLSAVGATTALATDTQFETGTSTTLAPQVAQVTRATEAVSQILSMWDGSSNPATSVQVGPIPTVTAGTINTNPYDAISDRFIVSSATGGNSGLAYQARLEWSNPLIDWKRTAFCYDTEQEAGNWQLITYFGATTSPNNINQNASGGGFGVGIFRVTNPADTYLFALTPYIGSGGSGGEITPSAFFNGAVTNAIPGDLANFNGFNITETNPRMGVMIVRNERVISFYVNRLLRAEFTLTPAQNSRATGSRYGFFGDGGNAKRVYLYGLSVGNPALSLLDRNCLPLEGAIVANTAKRTYPSADETKVAGIATGATVGATAAQVEGFIRGFSYAPPLNNDNINLVIQPGSCRDSTNTRDIVLSTAISKSMTSLFAAGNNNGGRIGTSPASTRTWWKIYAIVNAQGVTDVAYTPVGTTLVLPTGFVASRRIGFIEVSVNSSNVHNTEPHFVVFPVNGGGLRFERDATLLDATLTASTTAALQVVDVPVGYELDAIMDISTSSGSLFIRLVSPLIGTTSIFTGSTSFSAQGSTPGIIARTNTAAQVYADTSTTSATITYSILTKGFIDRRDS